MRYVYDAIFSLFFIVVFFGFQCLVQEPTAASEKKLDQASIAQCLPEDQGVKSILTLEQRGNGLFLNCEKHERVSFASAAKSPARHISMAVPLSVE